MSFTMKSKARLGVESLEDRLCMSVTAALVNEGTVLQIHGDHENDNVWVSQDNAAGQIYVNSFVQHTDDNMIMMPSYIQVFDMANLERVEINLRGGDDLLTYEITNGDGRGPKFIDVNLGSGNDSAIFNFTGPQTQNYGGSVGGPVSLAGFLEGEVEVGVVEPVDFDPDADPIEVTLATELDQESSDEIPPTFEGGPIILPPTMTTLRRNLFLRVNAGRGHDQVDVQVGNLAENSRLNVDMNLGKGRDTGLLTLNGTLHGGSFLTNKMSGGKGADLLKAQTGIAARVEAGANFVNTLMGEQGYDRLMSHFQGFLAGTFKSHQGGGLGNDILDSRVQTTWDSTGRVSLIGNGDQGNDEIVSLVNADAPPAHILFIVPWVPSIDTLQQVDGGKGLDTLTTMGTPSAKNVESTVYVSAANVFAI